MATERKRKKIEQIDLKDYLALKEKEARRKRFKLPMQVKVILITPFLLIFCLGIYYIPYIIHLVATSPEAQESNEQTQADKIFLRKTKR